MENPSSCRCYNPRPGAHAVGGYNKDGFEKLSQAGDGVLTIQVGRLKRLIETHSPDSH
jgi:hypothetical protein